MDGAASAAGVTPRGVSYHTDGSLSSVEGPRPRGGGARVAARGPCAPCGFPGGPHGGPRPRQPTPHPAPLASPRSPRPPSPRPLLCVGAASPVCCRVSSRASAAASSGLPSTTCAASCAWVVDTGGSRRPLVCRARPMGIAVGVCPVEDGGTMGEPPSRRSGSPPQRIRDPSPPSRAGKGGGMGRSVPELTGTASAPLAAAVGGWWANKVRFRGVCPLGGALREIGGRSSVIGRVCAAMCARWRGRRCVVGHSFGSAAVLTAAQAPRLRGARGRLRPRRPEGPVLNLRRKATCIDSTTRLARPPSLAPRRS